jgi:hypothetical protein
MPRDVGAAYPLPGPTIAARRVVRDAGTAAVRTAPPVDGGIEAVAMRTRGYLRVPVLPIDVVTDSERARPGRV